MAEDGDILQELSGGTGDNMVNEFASYEDYLDSQISATDLYYLEDEARARACARARDAWRDASSRGRGRRWPRFSFRQAPARRLAPRMPAELIAAALTARLAEPISARDRALRAARAGRAGPRASARRARVQRLRRDAQTRGVRSAQARSRASSSFQAPCRAQGARLRRQGPVREPASRSARRARGDGS